MAAKFPCAATGWLIALCLVSGCTGPPRTAEPSGPPILRAPQGQITVDAYQFQARLHRDGKPTSVRVQVFDADSIVGVSAQGYLGKGALKGFLKQDTALAWFPSTHEYIIEDNLAWIWQAACSMSVEAPDVFSMLDRIPTREDFSGVAFNDVGQMGDKYAVIATWALCPWRLELNYDLHEESWRLESFRFEFGDGNRLTARRNGLKLQTEIPTSRFYPEIPADAIRVIP